MPAKNGSVGKLIANLKSVSFKLIANGVAKMMKYINLSNEKK